MAAAAASRIRSTTPQAATLPAARCTARRTPRRRRARRRRRSPRGDRRRRERRRARRVWFQSRVRRLDAPPRNARARFARLTTRLDWWISLQTVVGGRARRRRRRDRTRARFAPPRILSTTRSRRFAGMSIPRPKRRDARRRQRRTRRDARRTRWGKLRADEIAPPAAPRMPSRPPPRKRARRTSRDRSRRSRWNPPSSRNVARVRLGRSRRRMKRRRRRIGIMRGGGGVAGAADEGSAGSGGGGGGAGSVDAGCGIGDVHGAGYAGGDAERRGDDGARGVAERRDGQLHHRHHGGSRDGEEGRKQPKVHFFNTFFVKKMCDGDEGYNYNAVRRWTTKKKLGTISWRRETRHPVHQGIHWVLAVVDLTAKKIVFYDSLLGGDKGLVEHLKRWVRDEYQNKREVAVETSGWTAETPKNIPKQMNGARPRVFYAQVRRLRRRGSALRVFPGTHGVLQEEDHRGRHGAGFELRTDRTREPGTINVTDERRFRRLPVC